MFPILQGLCKALTLQVRFAYNNEPRTKILRRPFHMFQSIKVNQGNFDLSQGNKSFLGPTNLQNTQYCGLKHVGNVHSRCKDCHLMFKEGVMYNYCKTHPRHNQKAKIKRPKNTWTLTAVTTARVRPW